MEMICITISATFTTSFVFFIILSTDLIVPPYYKYVAAVPKHDFSPTILKIFFMKRENQVCTLDQAKKLKELGISQDSLCWYVHHIETELVVAFGYSWTDDPGYECYPEKWAAFNVAELGAMLSSKNMFPQKGWEDQYWYDHINGQHQKFKTEAETRAALLIDLLERKVIKVASVNKRLQAA